MDSKRKVSQVLNNNPQGSQLRRQPKNRWWNCILTDFNKSKIADRKERGQKTELNGRSPSRRRRSTLDCSAMKKKKKYLVYLFLLELQGVIFLVIF
jgi:hypothetical protein